MPRMADELDRGQLAECPMTHAPKRRWSFSLRTLFVVVTLACVWLGWNASIVQRRKAFSAENESGDYTHPDLQRWDKIPRVRQWMGDNPQFEVRVHRRRDIPRARELFPEAGPIICDGHP
jgi:hypothetical protein